MAMEGLSWCYVPVEDIVANWRVREKETGVRTRREEVECLKAFVKQ
jgi:hypothetical protein